LENLAHIGFGLSSAERVKYLNDTRTGSMAQPLDITFIEVEPDRVVATMPVGPNTRQPAGFLHGGASVALAETVASLGTAANIDMTKQNAFGLEINANHIRPKRDGLLTAEARPIHKGRTTFIWNIEIRDEAGKLVCISRCTVAVVDLPPTSTENPT
jgi:uncharacterized protein (TIGR00369 family)